jgi:glycosyltransferase involved in cell wall biosynthesis
MRRMMSVHVVSESESRTPRVSVIVPALNSARTIGRCMEALGAQQTAHLFEVIVVHSGEDDTCAVAAGALPPARTVQLPERALAARARAAGVAVARGDIFAFIDSDAYAAPDWIEQVVRSAESGRDLICGSIGNANPDSAVARAEQLVMFSEFLSETPQRPMWFALSGNLVMRRAAYERFGPFVEIRASEDLIFSRRVAMAGGTILFAPRMRVFHDNRRRLRPYLRNQLLLGTYTAMARRVVPFEDSRSWPLFLALLPIAPAAKLAKIVWRLVRWCPRQLLALVRALPLVLLGVIAYGIGQVRGAFSSAAALEAVGRTGSTTPSSADDSTSPSHPASRPTSNSRATVRRPAAPKRWRSEGSASNASMASASAPTSPGGTTNPATPSSTSSDTPATRVDTTGTPDAMASMSTTGTPSAKLGSTNTSVSCSRDRTWSDD